MDLLNADYIARINLDDAKLYDLDDIYDDGANNTKYVGPEVQFYHNHAHHKTYNTNYLFKNLHLNEYFDGILSSSEIGFMKQQIEFWQKAYNRIGSPEKKSILCWDNEKIKLEAAKEFGFLTELYVGFNDYENKIKQYIAVVWVRIIFFFASS